MKEQKKYIIGATALLIVALGSIALTPRLNNRSVQQTNRCCQQKSCTTLVKFPKNRAVPKYCVFKSIFKEENNAGFARFRTPDKIRQAVDRGLSWILNAQQENGAWGAGLNTRQGIMDPHAVQTDPATTAMVGLALLRNHNTLSSGTQQTSLIKLCNYIIQIIDKNKSKAIITLQRGTQIQVKLGQHIDAVICAQFLSNLKEKTALEHPQYPKIKKSLQICVEKIQASIDQNGKTSGGSWAGVLQSSMSTMALESAEMAGASVTPSKLEQSRSYQKSNYNKQTGTAKTEDGAGIMLYALSSSVRGAAKEARNIREIFEEAKQKGLLEKTAAISVKNLEKIGYSKTISQKMNTAYQVYESAKIKAQEKEVMQGFGNNGGEEFVSFLQTGESLILNKDSSWKTWFENIGGKMLTIQNNDGSWNGHHCITSPAFCTATCLLILSIENDFNSLEKLGKVSKTN